MTRQHIDDIATMSQGTADWHIANSGAMATLGVGYDGNTGHVEDLGDGTTETFTVTHNLGTDRLCVHFWDNTTGEEVGLRPVQVSSNAFTVAFATPPGIAAYRVVVNPVRVS